MGANYASTSTQHYLESMCFSMSTGSNYYPAYGGITASYQTLIIDSFTFTNIGTKNLTCYLYLYNSGSGSNHRLFYSVVPAKTSVIAISRDLNITLGLQDALTFYYSDINYQSGQVTAVVNAHNVFYP